MKIVTIYREILFLYLFFNFFFISPHELCVSSPKERKWRETLHNLLMKYNSVFPCMVFPLEDDKSWPENRRLKFA
jgi:hypothetical protein